MNSTSSFRPALTSVVVVLALLMAGCTQPPTTGVPLQLDESADSGSETQLQATPTPATNSTTTAPTNPVRTPASTVLGKNSMKQLADFEPIEGSIVTMETSKGTIVLELFRDKAPLTTLNFLSLIKDGYYDGILFHRVIPDFMAQFGDPLTRDPSKQAMWGTGGAGYTIPDEFSPDLKHDSEGILSMANSGPNSGSSQMFITYGPTPWLDGKHAVFGKVTSGMDVLRQLENGDKITGVTFK